jgi:hypothetical protein
MNNERYKEIWVDTDSGQSMCALINGNYGWLMYLPDDEGNSFSSRNPDYKGDKNMTMEFYLNNGQRDEYPLSWVLPIGYVEQALEYFEKEKKLPPFINWHNDSE